MVSPDNYYLVCKVAVAASSQIDHVEIKNRIFKKTTVSIPVSDYMPGQPTTLEDDGYVKWTVTRTNKVSPDGWKKMAYVVGWARYKDESTLSRKVSRLRAVRCDRR
jgi:hypothetical protein